VTGFNYGLIKNSVKFFFNIYCKISFNIELLKFVECLILIITQTAVIYLAETLQSSRNIAGVLWVFSSICNTVSKDIVLHVY